MRSLLDTEAGDKFKLSQKTSSVSIHVARGKYYFKAKVTVPNDYPEKQVRYSSLVLRDRTLREPICPYFLIA